VVRVLFASDLHARPDAPERERVFLEFLRTRAVDCDALYLLGDVFEFGFVFNGEVLPQYEELIERIAELAGRGTRVYFLGGNHDLWMSGYLHRRGIRILHDGETRRLFGTTVQFFHGILRQPDPLSQLVAGLLGNPDAVWLYSLVPKRIGFRMALQATGLSRKRRRPFPSRVSASALKPLSPDAEIVITGHHHRPFCFKRKGVTFWSSGNWITDASYLEMTPEGLELKTFSPDALLGEQGESAEGKPGKLDPLLPGR